MYRNYTDENFIRVFNDMTSEKSERKLSIEELYVYCVLNESRNADIEMSMTVNVNLIHYRMPVKFVKKESENKKKIREAIKTLVDKEFLVVVDSDIKTEDITNNTFFTTIINPDLEGFEQIHFNEYRMMKLPSDLFIFAVTKRFTLMPDSKGYKASFNRWAEVLGVSDKTAQKMINDAEYVDVTRTDEDGNEINMATGVIHILRGRYVDKNNQELNLYRHVDFMDEEEPKVDKQEPKGQNQKEESNVKTAFGSHNSFSQSVSERVGDTLPF